jgi:hypothetical protein
VVSFLLASPPKFSMHSLSLPMHPTLRLLHYVPMHLTENPPTLNSIMSCMSISDVNQFHVQAEHFMWEFIFGISRKIKKVLYSQVNDYQGS